MSFSERQGLKPVRSVLQVKGMDADLRASLWNVLHVFVWDRRGFMWDAVGNIGAIWGFARHLWYYYYKQPITDIPSNATQIRDVIQERFFDAPWNEVYDLLECIVEIERSGDLEKEFNKVLERELAGYRLIEHHFIAVTDEQEVAALQEALGHDKFGSVTAHLSQALLLLSDRKNPDYRNSMKESISAVEGAARLLTKNDKATLGDALKLLEQTNGLHGALREGFSKLYGYTSDADGIRHSLMDKSTLTAADAKLFLLLCTSFINYLKTQCS